MLLECPGASAGNLPNGASSDAAVTPQTPRRPGTRAGEV